MEGNNPSTTSYHDSGQGATESSEIFSKKAGTFKQRIGSTIYLVNVHYSQTSQETINQKITRLVKNDISGVIN